MSSERRPARYKKCAVPDCEWRLVTAEFVGSPDTVVEVPWEEQQRRAGEHMRVHYTHTDAEVIDLGQARRS